MASWATAPWATRALARHPLKRVLEKAGIQAGARQVTFEGLDRPVLQGAPEFVKALDAATRSMAR